MRSQAGDVVRKSGFAFGPLFLPILLFPVFAGCIAQAQTTVVPGEASAISANARGDLWALGTSSAPGGYAIYRWANGNWQNMPGGAVRIAVDPDGSAWAVTNTGAIFHSNASNQWVAVAGSAVDIAAGANGAVWVLGPKASAAASSKPQVLEYQPWSAIFTPGTRNVQKWQVYNTLAVHIAVDPSGNPWTVNAKGVISRFENGKWVVVPGAASQVAVGADGTVYAVGTAPEGAGGFPVYRYQGTGWVPINAMGADISAGPTGTLYIVQNSSARGTILRYAPAATATTASAQTPHQTTVATSQPATTSSTIAASTPATATAPASGSSSGSAAASTASAAGSSTPASSATAAAGPSSPASLTAQGWKLLPGAAMDIGADAKGDVWAIGTGAAQGGYGIYHLVNGNWQQVPGGAVRITVDTDGTAWAVNNSGNIFHSSTTTSGKQSQTCRQVRPGVQSCTPSSSSTVVQWTMQPGGATDIAVGANGDVWAIGSNRSGNDYGIYKAIFAPGTRNVSSWQQAPGAAVRIAVGPDGSPWVVNSAGSVYYMLNGNWVQVAINGIQDVSVGPDGIPYLAAGGAVLRLMPSGMNQPNPAWLPNQFASVPANNIAAGAAGTVYVTLASSNQNEIASLSGLPTGPTVAANGTPWTPPAAATSASGTGSTATGNTASSQSNPNVVVPPAGNLTLNQPGSMSVPVNPKTAPTGPGSATSGTLVAGQQTLIGNGSGQVVSTSSQTPLQVTGLGYVPIAPPAGAVQLVPNLVYQKYVYVPGHLLCSDSANLGLSKGLAACGTTDAGYVGPYNLTASGSCPNGQFPDSENGGECWQCPPDPGDGSGPYIRSGDPVTSSTACWRILQNGSQDKKPAIFVAYNGCPDPNQKQVFPDSRRPGQPFLDIASGISVANTAAGACWTCPTSDVQGNYQYTDRNGNTLIGSQTGNSCTTTHSCNNGCTIHFSFTPAQFIQPGLSGLAGVSDVLTQEQVFQQSYALTTYLYGVAQANNISDPAAFAAAQWQDISVHPYGNPYMKALVHQFMIGDAPAYLYASGVQGQESTAAQKAHTTLVNAFQEYMQARNTYVAQQALDMYYAWKSDVAAQSLQSEVATEFNYGTVPLDFQSIVQGAIGVPVSAAGVIGTIVAAQRYAAIVDSTKTSVFANANSNITSAARSFRVSDVLSNLFSSSEEGAANESGSYISSEFAFRVPSTGNAAAALSSEVAGESPEEAAASTAAMEAAEIDLVSGPVGIALAGVTLAAMAIQQEVEIAQAEPQLLQAKNTAMQPVNLSTVLQQKNGPDQVAIFWGSATGVASEPGDQSDYQLLAAAQAGYAAAKQSNFATLGSVAAGQRADTAFMNVSNGYIGVLSSITGAVTPQNTQQIQTVQTQYNTALAQLQGTSLSSAQQTAVNTQEQQVNAQLARIRSLPGGAQATRKKLPGE